MARLAPISVPKMPSRAGPAENRSSRGRAARLDGRRAEWFSALILMAKGYRMLGFRLKAPGAEIDLLAAKGGTIAVIEVKRRRSLAEALEAVSPRQRRRLTYAARQFASRRPGLAEASVRIDLMALAPNRWPRHIRNAWPDS